MHISAEWRVDFNGDSFLKPWLGRSTAGDLDISCIGILDMNIVSGERAIEFQKVADSVWHPGVLLLSYFLKVQHHLSSLWCLFSAMLSTVFCLNSKSSIF